MKFMEFDYTKSDGSVTHREVVVVSEPCQFVRAIDVSELDADSFSEFVTHYRTLKDEYDNKLAVLMKQMELHRSFRQFKPEGMTNTNTEWI
jgi:hypothetical protein